jgi:hypothetical protein
MYVIRVISTWYSEGALNDTAPTPTKNDVTIIIFVNFAAGYK